MLNAILHTTKNFHLKNKSADENRLFNLYEDIHKKFFIMYRANVNGQHTALLPCLSSCPVRRKRLFLSCFFASGAFLFDYQSILTAVVSKCYESWNRNLSSVADGRYVTVTEMQGKIISEFIAQFVTLAQRSISFWQGIVLVMYNLNTDVS